MLSQSSYTCDSLYLKAKQKEQTEENTLTAVFADGETHTDFFLQH